MSKWNEIYKEITSKYETVRPNPPATREQISDAEKLLENMLPTDPVASSSNYLKIRQKNLTDRDRSCKTDRIENAVALTDWIERDAVCCATHKYKKNK